MKLILLGAPGAGKGTQAEVICKQAGDSRYLHWQHSARGHSKRARRPGMKAKTYMDAGQLVPDEVIIGIVKERLAEPTTAQNGFILDGVPRTIAAGRSSRSRPGSGSIDRGLPLRSPTTSIMQPHERPPGLRRLAAPATTWWLYPPKSKASATVCGGKLVQRKDDTPETVKDRLEVYHRETEPLKDFYASWGPASRWRTWPMEGSLPTADPCMLWRMVS